MAVALRYPFRDVRRRLRPVVILLLVAMPAMAITSAGLGWLVLVRRIDNSTSARKPIRL
jgi:hypothetical protein